MVAISWVPVSAKKETRFGKHAFFFIIKKIIRKSGEMNVTSMF